jgi:tetratricopeptide (TPR) repeat protein
MRFYFVTPVWGVNHLGLFLNVGLPSLLSSGNIPGLTSSEDCRFLIYTRAEDEGRLVEAPVFHRLQSCLSVEIHIIAEPISNAHRVMTDCHVDTLRRADEDDAAAIFIPPDCVWSDGSMVAVGRIARSGKSMIHMSGIRLDRDAIVPRLQSHLSKDGCALTISARQLVALGLAHLHPIAFTHFWNEHSGGLMPANLYWTVPGEGLALRCFHLHPLMVKSQIKFAPFKSTIDDDLALHACPDFTRDHVVTDSEEILAFELSGLDRVVGADFQKGSVEAVASWAEVGTNRRHHLLAQFPIRIHFGNVTEGLWGQIEADGTRVISEVLRINQLRSSVLALRHPAVLVWRYYAMTVNQGRYSGQSRPASRLLVRLFRQLIHGNRRVRRFFVYRDGTPRPWHPRRLILRTIAHQPQQDEVGRARLIDPLAAAAAQRRADAKRRRGNLAGAIRDYDEAITVSPPNTALYYLRGTAHQEIEDHAGAIADFEAGLKLDPSNATLHFLLQQSRAALEQTGATIIDPARAAELQRQGDAKRALGDRAGAIRDYSAAIATSPPNTALHYLRGTTRLEQGNLPGALQDFKAGLKLEPNNRALRNLAWRARTRSLELRVRQILARAVRSIRLLHPLWLVHRSTLATMLDVIGPADRTVLLLGDNGRFAQLIHASRLDLVVTATANLAASSADGGDSKADVAIVVDLDGGAMPTELLSAANGRASRLVCIRIARTPVHVPSQLAVESYSIGGPGTRMAYATYRLLLRVRAAFARLHPVIQVPIYVLAVPLAILGGVGLVLLNVAGFGLDVLSRLAGGGAFAHRIQPSPTQTLANPAEDQ